MDKNILCVDACNPIFQKVVGFRNFNWDPDFLLENAEIVQTIIRSPLSVDRAAAEKDDKYLQIIPYLILEKIWDEKRSSIFIYERTKKGNEDRLHNNFSLGVGGHVPFESSDNPFDCVLNNVKKELFEEFSLSGKDGIWYTNEEFNFPISLVGSIRDTSNEVGNVHFGLVFKCVVPQYLTLFAKEDKVIPFGFISTETLKKYYKNKMENWSLLCLEGLKW